MTEILKPRNLNLKTCNEAFTLYLPSTKVERISFGDLPRGIKEQIEKPEKCKTSLLLTHFGGNKTFVGEELDMSLIHLQDMSINNQHQGAGAIYIEPGEEDEIVIVGNTTTIDEFQKQGLGTRRLFTMNALARARFGSPIYSTSSPKPQQRSIWERLVEQEVAEKCFWEGTQRYKFI